MISTKVHPIFLLIILSISGYICYDYEEPEDLGSDIDYTGIIEKSLCNPHYSTGFEIINIFNLRHNIYIQSKDQNGIYDLWRIPIQEYDFEREWSDNPIQPLPHQSNQFLKKILINLMFDFEKPIFGFVSEYNVWSHYINRCLQGGVHIDDCLWAKDVHWKSRPELICIYGTSEEGNRLVEPMFHDYINGETHWALKNERQNLIKDICDKEFKSSGLDHKKVRKFVKWRRYGTPNMQLVIGDPKEPKGPDITPNTVGLTVYMFDRNETNLIKEFYGNYKLPFLSMGFYYNDDIKFLFCGEFCNLDSVLQWTTELEPPASWLNESIKSNGVIETSGFEFRPVSPKVMTVRSLLYCETARYYNPFQPNDYCAERQEFLSIFNLGRDVFFQRSGRFWRYNHLGFTADSNDWTPAGAKISPMRYDSDFTNFLENEGFDTSSKIVGTNFKAKIQPMCTLVYGITQYQTCENKYLGSQDYFRVCIYGARGRVSDPSKQTVGQIIYRSYQYTPGGLLRWSDTEHGNELKSDGICHGFIQVWFGRNPVWSGGEHDPDPFEVFSITNPSPDESKSLSSGYNWIDTLYNRVYSFSNNDPKGGQNFFKHEWKWKGSMEFNDINTENIPHTDKPQPVLFLFSMNGKSWGWSKGNNGSLHKFNHDDTGIYIEPNISQTLNVLLGCPSVASTSVLTMKRRQKVCQKYDKREPESVFYIGSKLYHQMGKYFYQNIEIERKKFFRYDRYVTNLLNDHFDTSVRVSGYSMKLSDVFPYYNKLNEYEVAIYGTSILKYRRMGKKIYALFRVDEDTVPVLRAISDVERLPNASPFNNLITFGYVNPISRSGPKPKNILFYALTAPDNNMKNESIFLAYVEDFNDSLTFRLSNKASYLNFPFSLDTRDWLVYTYKKVEISFDQFVGISKEFSLSLLARNQSNPNQLVRLMLTKRIDANNIYSDHTIGDIHLLKNNSWDLQKDDSYQTFYCGPDESPSETGKSVGSGILSSILVTILLVLMIIALIVGITGYFQNEKNNKNQLQNPETTGAKPQNTSNSVPKTSKTDVKPEIKSVVKSTDSDPEKSIRSV